jgi:hypothetical protein
VVILILVLILILISLSDESNWSAGKQYIRKKYKKHSNECELTESNDDTDDDNIDNQSDSSTPIQSKKKATSYFNMLTTRDMAIQLLIKIKKQMSSPCICNYIQTTPPYQRNYEQYMTFEHYTSASYENLISNIFTPTRKGSDKYLPSIGYRLITDKSKKAKLHSVQPYNCSMKTHHQRDREHEHKHEHEHEHEQENTNEQANHEQIGQQVCIYQIIVFVNYFKTLNCVLLKKKAYCWCDAM